MNTLHHLGIDIAKQKFDVALIVNDKFKTKMFTNNASGFNELSVWLARYSVDTLHACMEATNRYGDALATYLVEKKFTVSVVNPATIKYFAQAQLTRNKNDMLDAQTIARFCERMKPKAWTAPPLSRTQLQALVQRREALLIMQTQEKNRLDTADAVIKVSLNESLIHLKVQIKTLTQLIKKHIDTHPELSHNAELLLSIVGVGNVTTAAVLGHLPDIKNFTHQNHVVAFAGLNPKQKLSGSSVHGKSSLSKVGCAALRKALFLPAMVALKHNPVFKQLAERLTRNHKSKMVIIGAAMRKLLVIIYGVLKSNEPFNPERAMVKK
jgi:transposase